MACLNCGADRPEEWTCCPDCPRVEPGEILLRLTPTPGASGWNDIRAQQWRDPATGKDYFAVDAAGDIIVAGGLQECTAFLVEARR
jgi:hypothetical protein